ncbi:phosphinothricin acetyltransferase [Roseovarius nanhaiticus]|uniref:Phosphinothricin acetyltransferase n=1 Tax=Roseovarius nanhaiticus TaxID=573024 RepID=A0A1N7HDR4_9RHOB|nr:GNAT family N-acetyltransferase [Roseovarius nanhaiticus]SEL00648.1 phosphinothricin acetyltransferase [Roseovarius nanhaiticus]SIS23024.1 phosphinothricin acetyltransferase [Roseovarius nanhaiticus]
MIVRDAERGDIAPMMGIWNPQIRETSITFTTIEKTEAMLEDELAACAAEGRAFLVAEEAGAVIGLATWFAFRKGPGYAHSAEHTVVLAPQAQGRGAGRLLMRAIEDHARAAGVHVLVAGVTGENSRGIAFHRALGFDEVGRMPQVGRKFRRWMDLVLLQKIL